MTVLLLLVPIALVLVVVSILGLAGLGPLTDDRRADRAGLLGAVGPLAGLLGSAGIILVAVVASITVVGVGDGGSDDARDDASTEEEREPAAAAPSTTMSSRAPTPRAAPRERRVATLGPNVTIAPDDDEGFPDSYGVADRLQRDTVLRVTAHGFEPFDRGVAEQCAPTIATRCFNHIPVQFDEDGIARFQYLVSLDFVSGAPPAGRCRVGTPPCAVVVRSLGDGRWGQLQTVFGVASPPPGRITVSKPDGLSLDGERVTVTVRDYPPGATVRAMLCAAPEVTLDRCGRPGPQAPLVVGPDGTGSTELLIEPGPVGAIEAACGRGDECGITVASREVFARAPTVPISFAGRGGAAYDPSRLALGLAITAILLGIATWLILRTDWSPVGEAAAPEIDDAEYADLDAIIAALPPEEEDELVGTHR